MAMFAKNLQTYCLMFSIVKYCVVFVDGFILMHFSTGSDDIKKYY